VIPCKRGIQECCKKHPLWRINPRDDYLRQWVRGACARESTLGPSTGSASSGGRKPAWLYTLIVKSAPGNGTNTHQFLKATKSTEQGKKKKTGSAEVNSGADGPTPSDLYSLWRTKLTRVSIKEKRKARTPPRSARTYWVYLFRGRHRVLDDHGNPEEKGAGLTCTRIVLYLSQKGNFKIEGLSSLGAQKTRRLIASGKENTKRLSSKRFFHLSQEEGRLNHRG